MSKTKNISEKAYFHIRETLLKSDFYVGQKILHHELGQQLGISHTPLREALFRLSAEGLLQHENYKGFSVPAIAPDEAREIYETRELIEPYLTERAADKMNQAKSKVFFEISNKYKQLLKKPYDRRRLLVDKKFHMEIAGLAGNNTLLQALNLVCDKLIFKSPFDKITTERAEEIIEEHSEILKTLVQKNGAKAANLMKRHIRTQKHHILENIVRSDNIIKPLFKKSANKNLY